MEQNEFSNMLTCEITRERHKKSGCEEVSRRRSTRMSHGNRYRIFGGGVSGVSGLQRRRMADVERVWKGMVKLKLNEWAIDVDVKNERTARWA
jgi:hypothetical protein